MAECDVQDLIDEACESGFTCRSEPELLAILNQLLCNLVAGGGGGGGGACCGVVGTGSPEGVQTGSPGRMYLDISNDSLWMKRTGTGTTTGWIQLIV
jgi:hypothetical protein